MSRTYHQPSPPQGPGSDHARMMCIGGAFAIAKLLRLYEINYTLRRVNVQAVGYACSAALLLIFANITEYHDPNVENSYYSFCQPIESYLNTCVRALDELSVSWSSAREASEFLRLLQRRWERKDRSVRTHAARRELAHHDTPELNHPPNKRARMSAFTLGMEQQLQTQQGPVEIGMGLDLDRIIAGFS